MKKKQLAVFLGLFALLLIMGSVFLFVMRLYRGTGLAEMYEMEEIYDFNGKIFVSQDRARALHFSDVGTEGFETLMEKKVDLSPFGFEGKEFCYYQRTSKDSYGLIHTTLYTADPAYEGFWPVSSQRKFVYVADDGKKYQIHPEEGLCYPMFSDSIEGVDPYGEDVLAFSANGSYAISLSGDTVTVYHTDPMDDSLRVVDLKKISLSEYGMVSSFGAFVGNTGAYFLVSGEQGEGMIALDCASGQTALSPLDPEGVYGKTLNRLYAQRMDRADEKKGLRATWSQLLLGQERFSPEIKSFSEISLFAVSPEGSYAIGTASGEGEPEILVMSEKRVYSLTSVLKEGEKAERIDFVCENVILVTLSREDGSAFSRCYKICF